MLRKTLATLAIAAIAAVAGEKLDGAGASFPAQAYFAWGKAYETATSNQVNYQSIGSGGGVKQAKARTVDFGASDEPQDKAILDKEKWLQFPTVIGSIVMAYNIDGIGDNQLKLSNTAIEGITMGTITMWNDPIIMKDNAGLKLPAEKITFVHRSDGSGTTYNFTVWMAGISKAWTEKVGKGKAVSWPVGLGAKGNEGVTNMIKQTPNSVGYIELSYKEQMGLTAAQLQTKSGKWVAANAKTVANAAKYAAWKADDGFNYDLPLQPGDETYPIAASTWILMYKDDVAKSKKVAQFFDWAFNNGDKAAQDLGFIALPKETKDAIRAYWKANGVM